LEEGEREEYLSVKKNDLLGQILNIIERSSEKGVLAGKEGREKKVQGGGN